MIESGPKKTEELIGLLRQKKFDGKPCGRDRARRIVSELASGSHYSRWREKVGSHTYLGLVDDRPAEALDV